MTYQSNIDQIQKVNSTTYVDQLGLLVGLDRLPGELSDDYLRRLETAVHLRREHPYEGAFNEINLQLGFEPKIYLRVQVATNTIISVSIAGIVIGNHSPIPILTFDEDTMWKWRLLSEVTADLNAIVPTTLLVDDGPAFQLARQTNSLWSFAEDVSTIQNELLHTGVKIGSEIFNQSVPTYSLTTEGVLTFDSEPIVGTKITYNYIVSPYEVVGAPVSMIGFKDKEFSTIANAPDGSLAYQLREFIQSIMLIDRSYWAK